MEGILEKWVNYIFGWRERYFVLTGNVLHYYYKRGEKAKGKIHLSVSQLNSTTDPLKLEIDTGLNVIYIRASTKELKDEWIRALKLAKLDGDNKMHSNFTNPFNNSMNFKNIESLKNDLSNSQNSNRNSMITEDKLMKKINIIFRTVEKIAKDNLDVSKIITSSDNPELSKLIKKQNVSRNLIF
jgi:hypothetical protein